MNDTEFRRLFSGFYEKYELARKEIGKVVVGLDDVIRDIFVAILARGHILVESAPGLGKTTTIEAVAAVVGARFRKLTFNANLMPDDLTHTVSPHEVGLRIDPGPLLDAEIFFANELNRGAEKTQSYLMSAMEEGVSYYRGDIVRLPDFRFMVADINPVETTGTYQIPEALAERFLMKIRVDFPEHEKLVSITASSEDRKIRDVKIETVFITEELLNYAALIFDWYKPYFCEDSWTVEYATRIVEWIRDSGHVVSDLNGVPASPSVRGAEDIKAVSRIYAFFNHESVVLPCHLKQAVLPALRGKFFLNREAIAKGLTNDLVISAALSSVPIVKVKQ